MEVDNGFLQDEFPFANGGTWMSRWKLGSMVRISGL